MHFSKLVCNAVLLRSSSIPNSVERSFVPITKHFRFFEDFAISYALTIDKAVSIITQILVSPFFKYLSHSITSLALLIFGIRIASGSQCSRILTSSLPISD
jgi:hypothetical protein